MRAAPVVARPWGVPLRVHWTFLLLALLPVLPVWPAGAPGAATRMALVVLLTVSVGVHEAAHVAAARRLGNQALDVILYPFGGVTRFLRPLMPGRAEALIAAAGPLASLCLAAGLYLLGRLAGGHPLLEAGAAANALLAAGNLLPAWPLDGGRLARSLLAARIGGTRATRLAGLSGQLLGLLVTLAGLRGDPLWIIPGVILFLGASSELHRLSLEVWAESLSVRDAMLPEPVVAPISASFRELRELSRTQPGGEILLVRGDRPVAYLPAARLWSDDAASQPLQELVEPLGPELEPHTPVVDAVRTIEASGARVAPVVDHGRVVGVVTLHALHRAADLAQRLAGTSRS